jgi:preprotein translocase subunit SecB
MTQATPESAPNLTLQRCYLKGLSVELPEAPQIFLERGELAMDLNLTLGSQSLDAGVVEVVVRGTLTGKLGARTVYLVEVEQAGIFAMSNIADDQVPYVLGVTCPSIVYPYMRAAVADVIVRTGLPTFHVPELNWASMFQAQAQASALAAAPAAGSVQ